MAMSVWKRCGFAWVTGAFFLFGLVGHWLFGRFEFVSQQQAHGQGIEVSQYVTQMARGTPALIKQLDANYPGRDKGPAL